MVLENGIIPPNALFDKLNPAINAEFLRVEVGFSLFFCPALPAISQILTNLLPGAYSVYPMAMQRPTPRIRQWVWLRRLKYARHP